MASKEAPSVRRRGPAPPLTSRCCDLGDPASKQAADPSLPISGPESPFYSTRAYSLFFLALTVANSGLQNTVTNVALPTLAVEFDATSSDLVWYINSYVLAFACLLLPMGATADRYGRRLFLNLGLLVFTAGTVAAMFVGSSNPFILTQIVMGIGSATFTPATLALVLVVFERKEHEHAIGVWTGLAGLGVGIGPLVGGLLLDNAHYSSVFAISLPFAAISLLGAAYMLPASRDENAPPVDMGGALLSTGAIALFVYAIVAGPDEGWASGIVLGSMAAGLVLFGVLAWWELRAPHPMVDPRLFGDAYFVTGCAGAFFTMFSLFAAIFFLTQYLQTVRGFSPTKTGVLTVPLALFMCLGGVVAPHVAQRMGSLKTMLIGLTFVILGAVFMAFFDQVTPDAQIVLVLGLLAFGGGLTLTPATSWCMSAVPPTKLGVGSSIINVMRQLGGSIGTAVLSSIQSTQYRNEVESVIREELEGKDPPFDVEHLITVARSSIAEALGAADKIDEAFGEGTADPLRDAAKDSWLDGMQMAMFIGAAILFLVCLVLAWYAPFHAEELHDRAEQVRLAEKAAAGKADLEMSAFGHDEVHERLGAEKKGEEKKEEEEEEEEELVTVEI